MKNENIKTHKEKLLEVGFFLRELRLNEGLTISDVSTDLNLHKNTIARIERGYNATLTSIFILADYYQIPINQIF